MGFATNDDWSFHDRCGRYTAQSPGARLLTKPLQSNVCVCAREREGERERERERE